MTSLAAERPAGAALLSRRWSWQLDWLVVAVLLAVRIALSLVQISRPGLQNDEVLFVNAATLGVPHVFLQYQVLGVPVMVFPYIGALKSWIYIPIFAVFGESPMSIRLPIELITTAGLVLLYPALRGLINRSVALLAIALLCFDNSLFWLTRDDVGPSGLEFFLKCAGIFCAWRFARTGGRRWVALLVLALALGVFNKLNFIWVVNAVALVSVGIGLAWRSELRRKPAAAVAWVGGLVITYAAFGAYYFTQNIGLINASHHHGNVLSHTWPQWVTGTESLLSGTWFYNYALGNLGPRLIVYWALLVLFLIGAVAALRPGRAANLPVANMALITVLIVVQMLVTYAATAGWHYVEIYPFIFVVASYGAWTVAQALRLSWRKAAVLMTAVAVAFLAYDGVLMAKYFGRLGPEPKFSAWSPAIYRLSNYLRHQTGTVVAVDWGIQPSLFALDPNRRWRGFAFGFTSSSPAHLQASAATLARIPGRKLIVSFTPQEEVFPGVDANLATGERRHLRPLATIRDAGGVPMYTVYRYH